MSPSGLSSTPPPHELLKRFLGRKQEFNPGYSLRAFSRDLGLSVSYVSDLLNGKKGFPSQRFGQITTKLGMDEVGKNLLSEAILAHSIRRNLEKIPVVVDSRGKAKAVRTSAVYRYLESSQRQYHALGQWYTIAILDLVTCVNFRPDENWIARRLGISPAQAKDALHYLLKSRLVSLKNGVYKKNRKKMRFPTTNSQEVVRGFHRQMIGLALQELQTKTDDASFEKRLISGITIASNPAALRKAKRRLSEALYEICEILSEGDCTELYQLNAQLFPLTKGTSD